MPAGMCSKYVCLYKHIKFFIDHYVQIARTIDVDINSAWQSAVWMGMFLKAYFYLNSHITLVDYMFL